MIKLKCNACDGACDDELDIRFGTKCDNNCAFCIEKAHGRPAAVLDVNKIINSLYTLNDHKSCINIVGGEPLLYLDQLIPFVKRLKEEKLCDHICVVTSLPQVDDTKLAELITYVDEIIVSFQHYDSIINNKLLRASNDYNRVNKFKILSKKYPAKLNVTLNISKSGINNEFDLVEALKFFESCGIQALRINELDDFKEWISIKDLLPKLKLKSPYAHGCSKDITRFFRKKYHINIPKIKCRVRCFNLESRASFSLADLIKIWIKHKVLIKEKKKNKSSHSLERNKVTVMYEDGTYDIFWKKFK